MSSGRAVSLVGAGTFLTDAGTTLTVSGLISGAGTLAKAGAGTLTLTADNNHTGGTTITAATPQLGNGGQTGRISGDVANNATLDRKSTRLNSRHYCAPRMPSSPGKKTR